MQLLSYIAAFAATFNRFLETMTQHAERRGELTELGRVVVGRLIGVSGGAFKGAVDSFGELLERTHWSFRPGPVSFVRMPTGPDSDRRLVSYGIVLARIGADPVVWLQRTPNLQHGRQL